MRAGFTVDEIYDLTKINRWFLVQIKEIVDFEEELDAEGRHWSFLHTTLSPESSGAWAVGGWSQGGERQR